MQKAMMKIKLVILAIGLLGCASQICAQRFAIRRTPTLSFGVQVVQPKGEFANAYDGYPAGFQANLGVPLRRSPIEVGFSAAWNSMGSQNEAVVANIGVDQNGNPIYSKGTMRIRSNNYRYAALLRFRPFAGGFQPYIDGLAGFEQFRTSTDIQVDNNGFSQTVQKTDRQRDFSLNIGFAMGLRIRISNALFVEGRFENIVGGRANLVDQNSIAINKVSQDVQFNTKTTKTDKYTYQLGFCLQF
jgi:hypothetical protein